jgi:hypothetical protein
MFLYNFSFGPFMTSHSLGSSTDHRNWLIWETFSWIYESEKEKHIKSRCPGLVALGSDQPWYSKDFNAGEPLLDSEEEVEQVPEVVSIEVTPSETETPQFVAIPEFQLKHRQQRSSVISKISNDVIIDLLKRLEGIWSVYEPQISSEMIVTEAPALEGITAPEKIKHAVQNEAIMQHLQKADMWSAENLYIEWGCGNANLSQQIQQLLHSDHILVDRKTPKTKGDSKRDRTRLWKRIVIDIKDIDLSKVPELHPDSEHSDGQRHSSICSFSKHLCGAATDLTIRGLEALNEIRNSGAVLIALCCHHRCTWQSYVGREFFEDTLGLTREDFDVMVRMSSWATSGEHDGSSTSGTWGEELTTDAKSTWGWRAKRILDVGRVEYLKKLGYETKFEYYVNPSVSLENILMISKRAVEPSAESSAPQGSP